MADKADRIRSFLRGFFEVSAVVVVAILTAFGAYSAHQILGETYFSKKRRIPYTMASGFDFNTKPSRLAEAGVWDTAIYEIEQSEQIPEKVAGKFIVERGRSVFPASAVMQDSGDVILKLTLGNDSAGRTLLYLESTDRGPKERATGILVSFSGFGEKPTYLVVKGWIYRSYKRKEAVDEARRGINEMRHREDPEPGKVVVANFLRGRATPINLYDYPDLLKYIERVFMVAEHNDLGVISEFEDLASEDPYISNKVPHNYRIVFYEDDGYQIWGFLYEIDSRAASEHIEDLPEGNWLLMALDEDRKYFHSHIVDGEVNEHLKEQ